MKTADWIDHLVDVHRHPDKHRKEDQPNVDPWIREVWAFMSYVRGPLECALPSSQYVDSFREKVIGLYITTNKRYEIVRNGVCEITGIERPYPLIPGGVIFQDLIRLETALRADDIAASVAVDTLRFLRNLAVELRWMSEEYNRIFTRIEKKLGAGILAEGIGSAVKRAGH